MKAIIVEDEFPAREELKYFIKNHSSIEVVEEFDNGVDVLKYLQGNAVDVVFLDINIPLLDGMVLAKTIKQFRVVPKVVFISAYKEYAVDAFELEAFDYLLKPYSDERIIGMLQKLEDTHVESSDKFSAWDDDRIVLLDARDVFYCEAHERETIVYTIDNSFVMKCSITEAMKLISLPSLYKCHRSYLVNLDRVSEIIPWFNHTFLLKFCDTSYEVPVSRSKVKEFKEIMHLM